MEPEVRCQVLDSFLQDSILVSRYGYYPWFNVNLRNIFLLYYPPDKPNLIVQLSSIDRTIGGTVCFYSTNSAVQELLC